MCRNGYSHKCITCGVDYFCRDEYPHCYDCFYGPPVVYTPDVDEQCDCLTYGGCEGPVDLVPESGQYIQHLCRAHQRIYFDGLYEKSATGWPA